MDALGISMGGGLGILAGTEVAQKISDNILAGNFVSAYTSAGSYVNLTLSGFTKYLIIFSGYKAEADSNGIAMTSNNMCNIIKSTSTLYFSIFGSWSDGNLYSYNETYISATLIAIE